MANKNSIIIMSLLAVSFLSYYISSGNPGQLIVFLGIVGVLIYCSKLIDYNRLIYNIIIVFIIIIQSLILINNYLYKTTYLQNINEYIFLAFGVYAIIFLIVLIIKPNLFKSLNS
jgi:hypothetical protein